jgi:hypothetical protein
MKLSEIIVKVIGIVLAVVGLLLVLSAVGISTGVGIAPWFVGMIVGVVFLGAGIWIIRGGNIGL